MNTEILEKMHKHFKKQEAKKIELIKQETVLAKSNKELLSEIIGRELK